VPPSGHKGQFTKSLLSASEVLPNKAHIWAIWGLLLLNFVVEDLKNGVNVLSLCCGVGWK